MIAKTDTKLAIRDALAKTLGDATGRRDLRQEYVDADDGPQPGWVVYERQVMLVATNRYRAENGLPLVDAATITRIDNGAAGHVDWLEKFALRCAAFAVGEDA
jgi:hypothetical protein